MSIIAVFKGFVAPAVFAAAVMLLPRWVPLPVWWKRIAAAVGLIGGFVLGYALLDSGQWLPKFHWHWLPYVALGTLVASQLLASDGKLRAAGWLAAAGIVVWAAWLFVPTWAHLEPSRTVYLAVWTPLVFAIAILLDPLSRGPLGERLPTPLLAVVLAMAMFAACVVIFLSGSARFTQIAGAAAGAMTGIAAAAPFAKSEESLRGVCVSFVVLLGGLLLIAQADSHSNVPLASYMLVPLAPLALWIVAIKPLRSPRGPKAWLALVGLPVIVLMVALALAIAAEPPW